MGVTIMIDHYQNTKISELRAKELRCEAEMRQLAEEAGHESKPFYAPLMNSVGQALIELGSNLQERYGEQQATPVPNLAHVNK
jgi:hypothetical protein